MIEASDEDLRLHIRGLLRLAAEVGEPNASLYRQCAEQMQTRLDNRLNAEGLAAFVPPADAPRMVLFLDKLANDLANDLEWTLGILDKHPEMLAGNVRLGKRYTEARRHLTVRRTYEAACKEAASQ